MSVTSDTVRKQFKEGDDIRDAGLVTPDDIVRFDDIAYGTDKDWQVLDLYRPSDAEGEVLPVIVSVHGGGWVYGDKERYQYYCMSLAQHGFAVVNFTYRLAPEFKFPASLIDTDLVFAWVKDHAEKYKLDVDHVFAVGDSAGAHMLAVYCEAATDEAYAKALGIVPLKGLCPHAVALNCGAYEIEYAEPVGVFEVDMSINLMADLLDEVTPAALELISPLKHMTDGFPPAFVMTAEDDFLRAGALPMVHALEEHNVECVYRLYKSPAEKLGHVFHCNMRLDDAAWANADECSFFHAHVR